MITLYNSIFPWYILTDIQKVVSESNCQMLSNNTLSPIYSAWKQKKFQMSWGIVWGEGVCACVRFLKDG